jgi:hypothetical protein
MAWGFAIGSTIKKSERKKLILRIEALAAAAGEEGYGEDSVLPGSQVLFEIERDDGKAAAHALGYAAGNYAAHIYYKQGVNPLDQAVSQLAPDYFDSLQSPVYALGRTIYDEIRLWGDVPIDRSRFDGFVLQTSYIPLPKRVVSASTWPPPVAE